MALTVKDETLTSNLISFDNEALWRLINIWNVIVIRVH